MTPPECGGCHKPLDIPPAGKLRPLQLDEEWAEGMAVGDPYWEDGQVGFCPECGPVRLNESGPAEVIEDDAIEGYYVGHRLGAKAERARIVAWLRKVASVGRASGSNPLADAIERGEHLK